MLYPSPISGLIHSRRLGLSLGINLMPPDGKICSFDCLYCECGFNADNRPHKARPTRQEVATALEQKLQALLKEGTIPDVLTFSGNGEPTLHPDFPAIIADVCNLRSRYVPMAKVSVLSNATQVVRPEIRDALLLADNPIMKLDTVSPTFITYLDRPIGHYDVEQIIDALVLMGGKVIVQTIFLHFGSNSNTTDHFVLPWLETLQRIGPREVMIYTIDRPTPEHSLAKATQEELDGIAERVRRIGFKCIVAY